MINVAGILCSVAVVLTPGAAADLPAAADAAIGAAPAVYESRVESDRFVPEATKGTLPDNNRRDGTGVKPQATPTKANINATESARGTANLHSERGTHQNTIGTDRSGAAMSNQAATGIDRGTDRNQNMAGMRNHMHGNAQGGANNNIGIHNAGTNLNHQAGTQGALNNNSASRNVGRSHQTGNAAGGQNREMRDNRGQTNRAHRNASDHQGTLGNQGGSGRQNASGTLDSQNAIGSQGTLENFGALGNIGGVDRQDKAGQGAFDRQNRSRGDMNRGDRFSGSGRNQADMRYNMQKSRLDELFAPMFELKAELDRTETQQSAKWEEYNALHHSYEKQLRRLVSDWVDDQSDTPDNQKSARMSDNMFDNQKSAKAHGNNTSGINAAGMLNNATGNAAGIVGDNMPMHNASAGMSSNNAVGNASAGTGAAHNASVGTLNNNTAGHNTAGHNTAGHSTAGHSTSMHGMGGTAHAGMHTK